MPNLKIHTCALTLALCLFALCDATAQTSLAKPDLSVGKSPNANASADFNGDGIADIATVNRDDNTVSILLGKGAGTLKLRRDFVTGAGPAAVVAADFNGDGIIDLAVLNSSDNTVSILLGHGDGTFRARTDYTAGAGANSLVVADFNGDGFQDLAISNRGANTVSIFLAHGDGTFAGKKDYPAGAAPVSLVTGNFNRDGKRDLAVVNETANSVSILMGNGDGTFKRPTSFPVLGPVSIVVGDPNVGGQDDLFVRSVTCRATGCVSTGTAYIGHGNGTFTAVGMPFAAAGSSVPAGTASTQQVFAANSSVTGCSQAPGVNICEPSNGANAGTSVRLFASANVPDFVLLRVYENNRNVYETSSQDLDINLGLTPGSNHLVLVAFDGTGNAVTAETTVNSSGSGAQFCTVPTDRTINICFPQEGNNDGAMFQLQARARWDNNVITHMRVYIDDQPVFDEDTPVDGYINPVLTTSTGVHHIVVVAWNIKGEAIVSPVRTDTFFN